MPDGRRGGKTKPLASNGGYGDAELVMQALEKAAQGRRPLYVIGGVIQEQRPPIGPYSTVFPNGSVTASGLGRKRVRRKKPKTERLD
jgi:hypothetical protein